MKVEEDGTPVWDGKITVPAEYGDSSKWKLATYNSGGPAYEYGKDWASLYAGPDPTPPRDNQCPHCLRDRHDGYLTETVARMWDSHQWVDYDPDEDTSRVVCVGSDHYGPALPKGNGSGVLTSLQIT